MAQHDYVIDNQSGSSFRSDLNNNLSAIVTTNSGSSAPTTTYAYMMWADTSNNLLKRRNGANNAWQIVGDLNGDVMVLDTSRRVGFGTSSPGSYNSNYDNVVVYQSSGDAGLTIATNSTSTGGIAFADGTSGTAAYAGYLSYDHSTNYLETGTNGVARMQVYDTGQHRITSTGDTVATLSSTLSAGTSNYIILGRHSASAGSFTTGTVSFAVYTNGNVQNTNNSYGSLSDEKLKENIVDASSQWEDIKGIRVRNYNFIEGQTHTQIGVIAQELEQVSPGLVSESPDRDPNGNDLGTTTKSVKYSILYMKSVKALQEAMARIEELEAKVAALEAA
jgi:hypothetical protein